ncbi:MAG: non-ribosomal peptide synthetase, partial [bacterium]|nr:non-ribosomal peptide synthetase [bacterium]
IAGELYIGGAAVGKGYLNNPELTAEKFVNYKLQKTKKENEPEKGQQLQQERTALQIKAFGSPEPFSRKGFWPPEASLYRTGDLARWLADGNIEFLGRIDHQVKIRGHRVELGEIENCLSRHPGISEVAVLARQLENGDRYLCAYYVDEGGESRVGPSEFRDFLSGVLPDYMIPSYFIEMEKIPLTPNGKIDRKTLAGIDVSGFKTERNYSAPRNRTEERLSEIWTDILGVEQRGIGINDNFFDIGGHSLRATVMAARIHKEFN